MLGQVRRNARHKTSTIRRGATVVEMAVVAPLLFLLLAGLIEFGQAFRIQHVLSTASRRSARSAIVNGATTLQVKEKAQGVVVQALGVKLQDVVVTIKVNGSSQLGVESAKTGDEIEVTTEVPFSKAGVGFFSKILSQTTLSSRCALEHE